jgi:hypothetical protein
MFRSTLATFAIASSSLLASSLALAFPIAAVGTEGFSVIVSSTNNVIATYQGNSASYSNNLLLSAPVNGLGTIFNNQTSPVGSTFDLGSFAIGTELIFELNVTNTGYSYFTGAAARNPDGMAHARVENAWQPNTTLVSFEDLYGTPEGAGGFNDLSFSFTNVTSVNAVPEPETLALMLAGLGLVGTIARRRKANQA